MSPVSISESRPFTIASGEPRHRMNTNAVKLASGDILVFYRDGSDHWRTFRQRRNDGPLEGRG